MDVESARALVLESDGRSYVTRQADDLKLSVPESNCFATIPKPSSKAPSMVVDKRYRQFDLAVATLVRFCRSSWICQLACRPVNTGILKAHGYGIGVPSSYALPVTVGAGSAMFMGPSWLKRAWFAILFQLRRSRVDPALPKVSCPPLSIRPERFQCRVAIG